MSWTYNEPMGYEEPDAPYSYYIWEVQMYAGLSGLITSVCDDPTYPHPCQGSGENLRCFDIGATGNFVFSVKVINITDKVVINDDYVQGVIEDITISCDNAVPNGDAGSHMKVRIELLLNVGTKSEVWLPVGYQEYSHVTTSLSENDAVAVGDVLGAVWLNDGDPPRPVDTEEDEDFCWGGIHLHQGWRSHPPATTVTYCNDVFTPPEIENDYATAEFTLFGGAVPS